MQNEVPGAVEGRRGKEGRGDRGRGGLRVARAGAGDVADLTLVDILEGLSQKEILGLAWKRLLFEVGAGETIYGPMDAADSLFFLCRGSVRIFRRSDSGRQLTLDIVQSGSVFGEACLSGQGFRGSYAEGMERCEVSSMRREDVEGMCLAHPQIGLRLARVVGERLVQQQGIRASGEYRLPVVYTHEDLAAMVGSTRSSTSRAFAMLRERGIVDVRARHICVGDLKLLQKASHDDFHRLDPDNRDTPSRRKAREKPSCDPRSSF